MTTHTAGMLREVVEVRVSPGANPSGAGTQPHRLSRVTAVVPCFNRPGDLGLLLNDLAVVRETMGEEIDLDVVVVDNASTPPIDVTRWTAHKELSHAIGDRPSPLRLIRLDKNTGGSGGFNAGMTAALLDQDREQSASPERVGASVERFLWLIDSDARVGVDTLAWLLLTMHARPDAVVVGSAVAEASTDGRAVVFEVGGRVNRRDGTLEPVRRGRVGVDGPIECDYVAACSSLVRSDAVRRAGLFLDVFLNADDAEWCLRLARVCGGLVLAEPRSVVIHPTFDRFPTIQRYYIARNCVIPLESLGLSCAVRLKRCLREVARAVGQRMMGRCDLASLHLRGLADAAAGGARIIGAAGSSPNAAVALNFEPLQRTSEISDLLVREGLRRDRSIRVDIDEHGLDDAASNEIASRLETHSGAAGMRRVHPRGLLGRLLLGPGADVAVVPIRGRSGSWLRGRVTVGVAAGASSVSVRRTRRAETLLGAVRVAVRGCVLATLAAARRPAARPMPTLTPACNDSPALRLRLGVVVLSYNRADALSKTLESLTTECGVGADSILVVDNGSTDNTIAMLAERWPRVETIALRSNLGVAAFNRGVERLMQRAGASAPPDLVLVLDDDARPDPVALTGAVELLARRRDLGAVTLLPRHPKTKVTEWPFALGLDPDDAWPVMGCGNIVRTDAWLRVGGYVESFFLYRNDTDLAMTLRSCGIGVHMNPAWVVWHDSPAAARKSVRWHHLATRNWVWLCRRHGTWSGLSGISAAMLGWAWAHRLAGLSPGRHVATIRGLLEGLLRRPPSLPEGTARDGLGLRKLLRLRRRRPGKNPSHARE